MFVTLLAVTGWAFLAKEQSIPKSQQNLPAESIATPQSIPQKEEINSAGMLERLEPAVPSFPDNIISTSDWQTYHNEEFGFEIRVPKDFKTEVTSSQELDLSGELGESFVGRSTFSDPIDPYSGLSILAYRESIDRVVELRSGSQFKDPAEGYFLPQQREAKINNVRIIYYEDQKTKQLYPGTYFLGNSKYGYEIHYTLGDNNSDIFEKILLSFKLTR